MRCKRIYVVPAMEINVKSFFLIVLFLFKRQLLSKKHFLLFFCVIISNNSKIKIILQLFYGSKILIRNYKHLLNKIMNAKRINQ